MLGGCRAQGSIAKAAWVRPEYRVDSTAKRTLPLEAALGVFTSAGVGHLRVQREADIANVGDLSLYSLDELEVIAAEKGWIRMLLDEKWRKVYRASTSHDLFTYGRGVGRMGVAQNPLEQHQAVSAACCT